MGTGLFAVLYINVQLKLYCIDADILIVVRY